MKIAIVRLSALGDIVNSAFVLQFIKQKYPDAKITWICEEVFSDIFKGLDIEVFAINLKQLKKQKSLSHLFQTIKKLKSLNEFDVVIDMQGLIKSALTARIISPNTHGFDKNSIREKPASWFYKTTTNIPYKENVVKRNAKIISDALKLNISDEMILNKQKVFPILHKNPFKKDTKNVVFIIGASWDSKIYPKKSLVEVINALDINAHIVWGSEKEKEDALFIASKTSASLAPKMSLDELVSFISYADLVIGNDTGPTHIAWAQNVASITIFGPTNERMIYKTSKNIAINSDSKVDILHIDKNDYSIKNILPKVVIQKAKELLNGI